MDQSDNLQFLELKSISGLRNLEFVIPSYQRGYRWKRQQVRELLEDIKVFFEKDNKGFYLLQPIIVKKKDQGKYELIDGQQRLTTIFLILKFLNVSLYSLSFVTREGSREFLRSLQCENKGQNIDYYRICEAWKEINQWFENNDKETFKKNLLESVKVIWYETDEDGEKVFLRVNSGKIPLTSAELIRAFFLQKIKEYYKSKEDIDLKRSIITDEPGEIVIRINAQELVQLRLKTENAILSEQSHFTRQWDKIMSWLRDEDFWWFLFNNDMPIIKRADEFFRLYLETKGYIFEKDVDEQIEVFYTFYNRHKNEDWKSLKQVWKEIKDFFNTLLKWFSDREMYHLVGFYLWHNREEKQAIQNLQKEKENVKLIVKDNFSKKIIELFIKQRGDEAKDNSFLQNFLEKQKKGKYKVSKEEIKQITKEINYEDDPWLIKLLLFIHNLYRYYHSPDQLRFPFKEFKTNSWSIEHIFPQNPDNQEYQNSSFIEEVKLYWEKLKQSQNKNENKNNNRTDIDEILDKIERSEKITDQDINKIIEELKLNLHGLENLTLLTSSMNKSVGNKVFSEKRKEIINQYFFDKKFFVPLATYMVFTKSFNPEENEDFSFWLPEKDGPKYVEDIRKALDWFLNSKNTENE